MAGDTRTYVRMDDGMPDNPKIVGIPGGLQQALAGWLHFSAICYGSKQKTDGLLPVGMVGRLTTIPDPEAIASLLLEANLWHAPGHHCRACVQPPPGHYVIHDYLEHQRSRSEIESLSEKRSRAGRKGGRASGETRKGQANAKHLLEECLKQNEADAVTDADTEVTPKTSSSPAPPDDEQTDPEATAKPPKNTAGERADVDALCNRLAELMIANECKPPTITQAWRDAARLMLDRDGRDFDKAMRLLEWCQADNFWKSNIHSMPKFRAQYDRLRQRANSEWEKALGATVLPFRRPADDTGTDAHMERYLARVAARKAAGETP